LDKKKQLCIYHRTIKLQTPAQKGNHQCLQLLLSGWYAPMRRLIIVASRCGVRRDITNNPLGINAGISEQWKANIGHAT
jgi:hypothetical protein